tara:strand:+ start:2195 stop:2689 length:495 start_codon:yes stop_codon:yes gene_type:complete
MLVAVGMLVAATACLPSTAVTENQRCFFGSTTAALHALETASSRSGCSIVDGECTCPTDPPDDDVCDNWAVNLLRYYTPHPTDSDFVSDLASTLASRCRTYGNAVLEENPPAEVPADTLAAACDRVRAPPAASTAGISIALIVGTSIYAAIVFENILDDRGGRS